MPLPISNGESGSSVRDKINQAFADLAALAGAEPYPAVATFASLPASPADGTTYIVSQASGVYFINRKPAGFYRHSGGAWVYLGEVPDSYFSDSIMVLTDNADQTKRARFEVSGVTSGQTRTLTIPDKDGVIATLGDISGGGAKHISDTAPDPAIHTDWYTNSLRHFIYTEGVWVEEPGTPGADGADGADGAPAAIGKASVSVVPAQFGQASVSVAAVGALPTNTVMCQLVPNAEWEADDLIGLSVIGEAGTDTITFTISGPGPIVGAIAIAYQIG
jgi:hypothetical protein